MKRFLLLPNMAKPRCDEILSRVLGILRLHQAELYMDPYEIERNPKDGVKPFYGNEEIDFAIVIGGDGSILDASQLCMSKNIPLIGINIGALGYLANVEADNLDVLNRIFTQEYSVRELFTLEISHIDDSGRMTLSGRMAINEVSVMHDSFQGIAELLVSDQKGGKYAYRCDGVILATPAGSTAYSFSAGGPLMDRDIPCVCLTPICPHTSLSRPVVYGAQERFLIRNISHNNHTAYVCADGKMTFSLACGESVAVGKSDKRLRIVSFDDQSTMQTLKRKMDKMEADFCHEE